MSGSPDDNDSAGTADAPPDANESVVELGDEIIEAEAAAPPLPRRPPRISTPPPVPVAARRTRTDFTPVKAPAPGPILATLVTGQPDSPTILDRALVSQTDASKARVERLAKELEVAVSNDRSHAALLAYELGELCERKLQNEERALAAYRRSFELDPAHRPNRWALRRVLYRRALWPELERLIDIEVKRAADDAERVDLLFERALISTRRKGADDQARTALVAASELAPHHQGVLFELERVVMRTRDRQRLIDVWERLAAAIDQPERKVAIWLEVARASAATDYQRTRRAFENAMQLAAGAAGWLALRVARERLRLADQFGDGSEAAAALDGFAQTLAVAVAEANSGERQTAAFARMRDLAALRRRQAQLVRAENPVAAWTLLQEALSLSPDEPVILADLIEIAAELGRYKELLVLVNGWRGAETETGRTRMLSAWCAEARVSVERRTQSRVLLGALNVTAPGFVMLTGAAECDALADAGQQGAELASAYLDAARAAAAGTWLGPGAPITADPSAAASLYIQGAEVLAYYVGTPDATVMARDALDHALEVVPGHPAALEALIELDDISDHPKRALTRCREMIAAAPTDRGLIERALRVATTHNVTDAIIDLQRRLVALDPSDCWMAWRLDTTLAQLHRDDDRAQLLTTLAKTDTDPARRRTALLGAARQHERAGNIDGALALYRELLPLCPQDAFIRDAYSDLLRTHERWAELASERRDAARTHADAHWLRRALREAAWVFEVRLDDPTRAAEVYEEWLARLPEDRTALEGIARCRAALRDPQREVAARATIAEIDQTTEAHWLYARSLERAGRYPQAIDQYRTLLAREETSVAVAAAALALGELAGTGANIALRIEATEALAKCTTDTQLGSSLHEETGWMHLLGVVDLERAAQAFAASLAIEAERPGALLGAAFAAARRGDRVAQSNALAPLAASMPSPAATAAVLLRSAAMAAAAGDSELAAARLDAAAHAAPDDDNVLFAVTEGGATKPSDTTDPFAAADSMVARADLLARRGALTDDASARAAWELDRADAFELAGQHREAIMVLASVLEQEPSNRRAIAATRRIARAAGDRETEAQAAYRLSKLSRDRTLQLRMLREAVAVYDERGPAQSSAYARVIYARIVELEPAAPEWDRYLEIMRETGEPAAMINALTDQLAQLAAAPAIAEHRMVPLLLERATLLRRLGNVEQARADFEALLAHAPDHVEALRQYADLAAATGDLRGAVAMWQRFLSVENTGSERIEIERLLADALDKIDDVVPPPPPVPPASPTADDPTQPRTFEDENGLAWELEFTAPDAVGLPPPLTDDESPIPRKTGRRISHVIRRTGPTTTQQRAALDPTGEASDPFDANTAVGVYNDPFGGQTATADLTVLQEEERRLAQAAAKLEADSVVAVANTPAPQRRAAMFTAPRASTSAQLSAVEARRTTEQQAAIEPRRTSTQLAAVDQRPAAERPRSTTGAPTVAGRHLSANLSVIEAQKSIATVAAAPISMRDAAEQVTTAAAQTLFPPSVTRIEVAVDLEPVLDPLALEFPERDLAIEDSAAVVMSYDQLLRSGRGEANEDSLHEYERELEGLDDPAVSLALRLEAGRLAEGGGELERARAHYEAALAIAPQSQQALRALRRMARDRGDPAEATRLLDIELAIASPRERDLLLRSRIDLLLATAELDAARIAVGELLERMPADVPVLLANVELALTDDRGAELASLLERLAPLTADELRGALQCARAVIAARHADNTAAGSWFTAAAQSAPSSAAMRLEAIRDAAARGQATAGGALLELAYQVEREDPITAAAIALRSQSWSTVESGRETLAAAAQLAAGAAPRDPLVGRIAAETALLTEEPAQAGHAFARWVRCKSPPAERAFAAARAAELDPARLGRLWSQVLDLDPGDDYAAARLRAVHVAAASNDQVYELDLQIAKTAQRDVPLLRAVAELVRVRRFDDAIELLQSTREQRPTSWALAEALADTYAAAKRWADRARVLAELVPEPGVLASDIVRLRSAYAFDRAARGSSTSIAERERQTHAALDVWSLVLGDDPRSIAAHAASISLAGRLEDRGILVKVLARARAAERSPWGASSLSLRYARMLLATNPRLALTVAREVAPGLDDPRPTVARIMAAVSRSELGDAVSALEDRATQRETAPGTTATHEPAMLRLRAAHIALDAGDVARAKVLLSRVDKALPGLVDDLLEVARQRAGEPAPTGLRPRAQADGFARLVRDGDIAAARGDNALALQLYQRANGLRPDDPFAVMPLVRTAFKLRSVTPIATYAREQLRGAQERGDAIAKADAYELLARVDEMRGDLTAAFISLENAAQLDPSRLDLVHQVGCELAATSQYGKLFELRTIEIERLEVDGVHASERDRVALLFDAATLAVHDRRSDDVVARLHHSVLELDRRNRLALFQLEMSMRRNGPSEQLAGLEEHVAGLFEQPAAKATFLTRAGETLAEVGKRIEAVQQFTRAVELVPDYLPALEAWYATTLAGELWTELAEAATRKANLGGTPAAIGALHHFAGVVLMDKARARDAAAVALRRALEAVPHNLDALLRLRILLEHTAGREHYAACVRRRLESETDRGTQAELHRLLAEHHRSIGQREEAVRHYRAMLAVNAADVRAHAAIADVSTDGDWRTMADAVIARIPLERDVQVLRTLHHRLGVIYADHDVAEAINAFQRALTYRPDDDDTLVRLTDLAIGAAQWEVAVAACDRLVTTERDPEKLASHLHRAALIFYRGFADRERADRMLKLAIESAPASTENLRLVMRFYREAGDLVSLRTQLERITELMRSRVDADVKDGAAYCVLSRALVARSEPQPNGYPHEARAAAELAQLLGNAGDAEQRLVTDDPPGDLSRLVGPIADDMLFAHAREPRLRELFRVMADPLARHLGGDLAVHGVGRKDRLRAPHPAVITAKVIATSLGFKDVEVYVATRHPYAMAAEPTNPVSLILGEAIVSGSLHGIRFAAGAALKLAQLALAIPSRLPASELGALGVAILRLASPDLTSPGVDMDAVHAHVQKLRRHVSPGVLAEVKAVAAGIDLDTVNAGALARDLKIAGLRAGLAASGSLVASLSVVAGAVGSDLQSLLSDPIGRGLISFALTEHRNPH